MALKALFFKALFSTHYNKKIICGKGGDLFGGPEY